MENEQYIIDQFREYVKRKQKEKNRLRQREKQKKDYSREEIIKSQFPADLHSPLRKNNRSQNGVFQYHLNQSTASNPDLKQVRFDALLKNPRLSSDPFLEERKENVTDKVSRLLLKTKRRLKIQKMQDETKFEKKIQIFKNLDTFIDVREFLQDLNIVNYENLDFLLERLQLEKISIEKGASNTAQNTGHTLSNIEDEEENSDKEEEDEVVKVNRAKRAIMKARQLTRGGLGLPPRRSESMALLPNTIFEYLVEKELGRGLSVDQNEEQGISKFDTALLHKIRRNFFSYKDKEDAIVLRAQRTGRYQMQMANLENFFEKHLRNAKIAGGEQSLEERIAKGHYIQTFKEHANKIKNLLVLTTKNIYKSKETDIDKKFKAQNKIHQASLKKIELLKIETNKLKRKSTLFKANSIDISGINTGNSGELTRDDQSTILIDESQKTKSITGHSRRSSDKSRSVFHNNHNRILSTSFAPYDKNNLLNTSSGYNSVESRGDDSSALFITEQKILDNSVLTSRLPRINTERIIIDQKAEIVQPKHENLLLPFIKQNRIEGPVFITPRRVKKSPREIMSDQCTKLIDNIDEFKKKFNVNEEIKKFDQRIRVNEQELQEVFQNYSEPKVESLRMLNIQDVNQDYLFKKGGGKHMTKTLKNIL